MQELKCFGIVLIMRAERCVNTQIQSRFKCIFNPVESLGIHRCSDKFIMYLLIV